MPKLGLLGLMQLEPMTLRMVKGGNPKLSEFLRDERQFVLGVAGWNESQIYFALLKSAHHRREFEDERFRQTDPLPLKILARTIWLELFPNSTAHPPETEISLNLGRLLDQVDRVVEVGAHVQRNTRP